MAEYEAAAGRRLLEISTDGAPHGRRLPDDHDASEVDPNNLLGGRGALMILQRAQPVSFRTNPHTLDS